MITTTTGSTIPDLVPPPPPPHQQPPVPPLPTAALYQPLCAAVTYLPTLTLEAIIRLLFYPRHNHQHREQARSPPPPTPSLITPLLIARLLLLLRATNADGSRVATATTTSMAAILVRTCVSMYWPLDPRVPPWTPFELWPPPATSNTIEKATSHPRKWWVFLQAVFAEMQVEQVWLRWPDVVQDIVTGTASHSRGGDGDTEEEVQHELGSECERRLVEIVEKAQPLYACPMLWSASGSAQQVQLEKVLSIIPMLVNFSLSLTRALVSSLVHPDSPYRSRKAHSRHWPCSLRHCRLIRSTTLCLHAATLALAPT